MRSAILQNRGLKAAITANIGNLHPILESERARIRFGAAGAFTMTAISELWTMAPAAVGKNGSCLACALPKELKKHLSKKITRRMLKPGS